MTLLSHFSFKGNQEKAVTDSARAIAVTAGAGSGKTLSLVGRYLHLLEQGYPLRSILAITFTEKAAREMRSRIRNSILNSEFKIQNFNLDSARIGTIHSLCAEILRAHPAEAGLDPAFEVLEEGLSAALQAEAIESALAWASTDEQSAALFGVFKENELRQILNALMSRRLDVKSLYTDASRTDFTELHGKNKKEIRENPRNPSNPCTGFELALSSYLANHLDSPSWTNALADLAAHKSISPEDKLELARQFVLAQWDEIQQDRAAQNWDALLTSLAALRKATSTQGKKDNWADIETVRAAMTDLRQIYDEHLKFLAEKSRFALDEQLAAYLPAVHRLLDQTLCEYQSRKDERQSLDFDDLESLAAKLLTEHPEVRAQIQSDLRAVLVDEFQDTNDRQRQIVYALTGFNLQTKNGTRAKRNAENADKKISENQRSSASDGFSSVDLFVVGDSKQCLLPDTPILTQNGECKIKDILSGDSVIAASGAGNANVFKVETVHQRSYDGKIVKITTASGQTIQCTPEHIIFTRLVLDLDAYYVYIMRHPEKGYRIGITRGYRSEKYLVNGLDARCRQEGGDAVWVIRRCESRLEAQKYEQLYMAQYGLPGLCFKGKTYQELDQDAIDFIFDSIPTRERAQSLANDLGLDLSYPHYTPYIAKGHVTLTYLSGREGKGSHAHRIHFETSDKQLARILDGFGVRKTKPSRFYTERWRVETVRAEYDDAHDFAKQIAMRINAPMVERYGLTDGKRWDSTPAGQVFPGLQLAVIKDGRIVSDTVTSVQFSKYSGMVYDLSIARVHNYIAHGIVVHNSIYKFRSADVTVFRQVQADIRASGGELIDLDLTFRAHKPLLENLNSLLAPILGETDDPARPYAVPFAPLRAYRQTPVRENIQPPFIEFHLGLGESAEEGRASAAQALANRLRELHQTEGFAWGDMALLFRSSTAYAVYENALEAANIPFVTVAGRGFYDRPEIRDLLNILAAIADPSDDLALLGLLRSPAFALPDAEIYKLRYPNGSATPSKLIDSINQQNTQHEAGTQVNTYTGKQVDTSITNGTRNTQHATDSLIHNSSFIIHNLSSLSSRAPAAAVLKRLLDLTHYRAILASDPNGARMIRNVEKLLADAHRSRLVSLTDFLAYVQTLRDVSFREGEAPADSSNAGAVQLMTVHKAKGLEFPLTVLADAAYEHRGAGAKIQLTDTLLLDLRDDDFHSTAWQLTAHLEDDRAEAEDNRLLYVAATRAKEKLLVSGHIKLKKDGTLSLAGWLDKFDFLREMSTPGHFLLTDGISATIYSSSPDSASDSPQPAEAFPAESPPESDLLPPLAPASPVSDEKTRARESDPPQRVWRIVSNASRKTPRAPAWLVGRLVHEAIRRWHFPAEVRRDFPDDDFESFLRPFALESGLTDSKEIHAAIQESRRLLERLRAHPLFAELDSAERHHEVRYDLPDPYGRGIMDLLYRTDAGWTIIDFKTDEVRSDDEARETISRERYNDQVARYARAISDQLKVQAKTRLVFLNVKDSIFIFDL